MTKWIEYAGMRDSTCPKELLDKKVMVRLRNGYESTGGRLAQLFTWENDGMKGNIVAYRFPGGL